MAKHHLFPCCRYRCSFVLLKYIKMFNNINLPRCLAAVAEHCWPSLSQAHGARTRILLYCECVSIFCRRMMLGGVSVSRFNLVVVVVSKSNSSPLPSILSFMSVRRGS